MILSQIRIVVHEWTTENGLEDPEPILITPIMHALMAQYL